MDPDQFGPGYGSGPARFIRAVFGLIFLGIGLTVIGFLWGAPFGAFHSPPLFFRIMGSFIALAFVTVGGGTAYAAISGKTQQHVIRRFSARHRELMGSSRDRPPQLPARDGYSCDNCGAGLGSDTEVSPHGDVKCEHCGRWFNIHAQ